MMEDVVYLRDLDGSGSMHVCAKDDPGAEPYVRDGLFSGVYAVALADQMECRRKVADLEAQLAARDAEIAAWLRESIPQNWPHERGALMTGTPVIPVHHNELIANAIERGSYRKETP